MKIRSVFVFLLIFAAIAINADETISGKLNLNLDLAEGSYTFGLSSNPINNATTQPNDVSPQLMEVATDGGLIGAIGEIQGNKNGNELHFYWNIASNMSFTVQLGIDTSGDGQGAMKKVGTSDVYLNWTISVVGEDEVINNENYSQKIPLYHHNPAINGHNSYSSKEIQIYTDPVPDTGAGTYNGTLIFSITT